MKQKAIIQLVALGTFTFALGIITTLTIQSVVGTPTVSSSSDVSSSSLISSELLSSTDRQPFQGFSNEWDVTAASEESSWDGLTPEIVITLENDYPGYDIDEVHLFNDDVFVFIEIDYLIDNGIQFDTDVVLLFNQEGLVLNEFVFDASHTFMRAVYEDRDTDEISDITNDPMLYRDGVIFTMETNAKIDINGELTPIDGNLSFLNTTTTYERIAGLYYFDLNDGSITILEQAEDTDRRSIRYTDFLTDGTRYLIGRNIEYQGSDDMDDLYFPFDIHEANVQSSYVFDYASYNPVDQRTTVIDRFGFYSDRVFVDVYVGYVGSITGEWLDFSSNYVEMYFDVYFSARSFEITDAWFYTNNMNLNQLANSLDIVVQNVDNEQLTNWEQIRYSSVYDLANNELVHLDVWTDLTDLSNTLQGYTVFDFENDQYIKVLFIQYYNETDDWYYYTTRLESYTLEGQLILTFEFDFLFNVYSFYQNEFDQLVFIGQFTELGVVDNVERVTKVGVGVAILDDAWDVVATRSITNSARIFIIDLAFEDTAVRIDIFVEDGIYDGDLTGYDTISDEHRLSIRMPLI